MNGVCMMCVGALMRQAGLISRTPPDGATGSAWKSTAPRKN
jgi:hypothetical protein